MFDRRDDRGGILPLTCVVMCFVALGFVGAARLGAQGVALAKSDAAAEAAALAAAIGADEREAARANGAELAWRRSSSQAGGGRPNSELPSEPGEIEVEILYRDKRAWAAAIPPAGTGAPGTGAPGTQAGGKRNGLAPEMLNALRRADDALAQRGLPAPVPVVSGYRSVEEQMALWARRATNPYPVAPPGKSAHNIGMAIDVPRGWVGPLQSVAAEAGLCQPFPQRDPIHFAPATSVECGGRARGRAPSPLGAVLRQPPRGR
ncbi:MAG: hypothetical protein DCC49_03945 [Acidobacteria bacterium]|nr:MAG: hypothetical protein DCC49_03945 [Acidobacteriota bacterium]